MSVFVVGALHLDVVVRAPKLPGLDETVTGTTVNYAFGGKGGNQALAACRLGGDVSFAGRVGNDRFGEMILDTLSSSGMDLTQLQKDTGPSGMSTAIVDENGDYGAVIVSAANQQIDADRISIPRGTKLVLLQNEIPEAVNIAVAKMAKDAGIPVWLNAAPVRPLPNELTDCIDLLIVNRVESTAYATQFDQIETLITLGEGGVIYKGKSFPAIDVDVISTHGAGDMFAGALAVQVAKSEDMDSAIAFAQAAAALHVSCDLADRVNITAADVNHLIAGHANR